MSRRSRFYGKVDFIWAEETLPLRAGRTYRVRVNRDSRRPRISKLLGEQRRV
jgi:hypothetical protein